jgi:Spy/CpxP family protein refolding chaperone
VIRPTVIFVLCFLTAFAAGVSGTLMYQRWQNYDQDGWLKDLHLSQDQREKIKVIWTEAMKDHNYSSQREKREALQKERDEALAALVTPEQKERFDEIQHTYRAKVDALSAEAKKVRDDAYEKTKAVLTEPQRVIYEELRKKRQESRNKSRGEAATATSADKAKSSADTTQQKGEQK